MACGENQRRGAPYDDSNVYKIEASTLRGGISGAAGGWYDKSASK